MLKRIAKTVLTKKMLRHLNQGTSVVKIKYGKMTVYITPGSYRILCVFKFEGNTLSERLAPPRISDYIVEGGNYEEFMAELKRRVR